MESNMKKLVLIFVSLMSFSAFAENVPPEPLPMPPTVGHEKISFVITKSWIEQQGDGYIYHSEEKCRGTQIIDLYDLRKYTGGWALDHYKACDVEFDGKIVPLNFYAVAGLGILKEFGSIETKMYNMQLFGRTDSGTPSNFPQPSPGEATIPDISNKAMILRSMPEQYVTCLDPVTKKKTSMSIKAQVPKDQNCKVINPVVFQMLAKFETL
jgi:hypothetical protein